MTDDRQAAEHNPSDPIIPVDPRRPLTAWQQAALSLYWFATSAHWTAILIILLPLQAKAIGGDEHKGATLGAIVLVGALASMVVAPFFGAWSDRFTSRWGRRKPFLVFGTLGNIVGLLAFAFLHAAPGALLAFMLVFIWVEILNNLATAPYNALIPDVVLPRQRGSASGWMGLMTMLGNFVGGLFGLVIGTRFLPGPPAAYIALAVIMLLGMAGTVLLVQEPPAPKAKPFHLGEFTRGLIEPFRAKDFFWVFFTRLLVFLGIFTVQEFLQFYFRDMVAGGQETFPYRFFGRVLATNAHSATTFFVTTLLIGAIISSLMAGVLSDKYGRKAMVYLSGLLQGVVVIFILLFPGFELVVAVRPGLRPGVWRLYGGGLGAGHRRAAKGGRPREGHGALAHRRHAAAGHRCADCRHPARRLPTCRQTDGVDEPGVLRDLRVGVRVFSAGDGAGVADTRGAVKLPTTLPWALELVGEE